MKTDFSLCQASIYGLSNVTLSENEKSLFKDINPWGFILYARNIESIDQLKRLTNSLRALMGRDNLPILIDQEGGRVARLQPPLVRHYPPAEFYGKLFDKDPVIGKRATYLGGYLIGCDLIKFGININCFPCLDVATADMHSIIGDRSYGYQGKKVSILGHVASQGLMASGVLPVIKHIPGHGRGEVDSHKELPYIKTHREALEQTDFLPFRYCHHLPLAMTGHLLFEGLDAHNISTQSSIIIQEIIRDYIGFNGLLMTDDISMNALPDSLIDRATTSLQAGCDVILHCNGEMKEMIQLATKIPTLSKEAIKRSQRIEEIFNNLIPESYVSAEDEWQEMIQNN